MLAAPCAIHLSPRSRHPQLWLRMLRGRTKSAQGTALCDSRRCDDGDATCNGTTTRCERATDGSSAGLTSRALTLARSRTSLCTRAAAAQGTSRCKAGGGAAYAHSRPPCSLARHESCRSRRIATRGLLDRVYLRLSSGARGRTLSAERGHALARAERGVRGGNTSARVELLLRR